MEVQSLHSNTLTLDTICPLQRCSFRTLMQQQYSSNPPCPYIIACTTDPFGNLFWYDAYALHSHFSILIACCTKIDYLIRTQYTGFKRVDSEQIVHNYLRSSSHKKQQENAREAEAVFHASTGNLYWTNGASVVKNGKTAARYLQEALCLNPSCFLAIKSIALLYFEYRGMSARVKQLLEKAYAINSYDEEVIVKLAKACLTVEGNNKETLGKVKELYAKALTVNPENPIAKKYLYGTKPEPLGKNDQHLPVRIPVHTNQSMQEAFEEAVVSDPDSPLALANLALFLSSKKESTLEEKLRALSLVDQALSLNPAHPFVIHCQAQLPSEPESIKAFTKTLSRHESLDKMSLDENPNDAFFLVATGQTAVSKPGRENQESAKVRFEEALQKDPTNIPAQHSLSTLLLTSQHPSIKNPLQACDLLITGCKGHLTSRELETMRDHLLKATNSNNFVIRDIAAEKKSLRTAIELDSENFLAYTALAELYQEEEDIVQAQELFERALAINPEYPKAMAGLGKLLFKQEKPGATTVLKEALRLDPSNKTAKHYLEFEYVEL
ncbi:MAG: hypothetical protein JSR46_10210 [Verrucomicrobia bacterium]|nr:hypothetical protein [Verrucomicrobiota bacterium]